MSPSVILSHQEQSTSCVNYPVISVTCVLVEHLSVHWHSYLMQSWCSTLQCTEYLTHRFLRK